MPSGPGSAAAAQRRKVDSQLQSQSDVTSLDPFLFYYCVPHKIPRGTLLKLNADTSHLLDSLVSALAVYATAFRSKLSLE